MSTEPVLSVVIPVCDSCFYTRLCLGALEQLAAEAPPFEVIVVDNGSTDGTPELLERFASRFAPQALRIVRHATNQGFARGCNSGAAAARTDRLLFLNNDVVLEPGSMGAMLSLAGTTADWGAIGARLLYPDGTLQHAGIGFDRDGRPGHRFRGHPADLERALVSGELQAVTGACLLVDGPLFQALGGFDERFRNSFEDVDLCLRIREAGRRVLYCAEAVGYHFEFGTAGRGLRDDANWALFSGRWKQTVVADWSDEVPARGPGASLGLLIHSELQRVTALARGLSAQNARLTRLMAAWDALLGASHGSEEAPAGRAIDVLYRPARLPRMQAGAEVALPVCVENAGSIAWSPGRLNLAYHWRLCGSADCLVFDGQRTPLSEGCRPGEVVHLTARVQLPSGPGRYELEWDAVEEKTGWLSSLGVATYVQLADVEPACGLSAVVEELPDVAAPCEELPVTVRSAGKVRVEWAAGASLAWRWSTLDRSGGVGVGPPVLAVPLARLQEERCVRLTVVAPGEGGRYWLELGAAGAAGWLGLDGAPIAIFVRTGAGESLARDEVGEELRYRATRLERARRYHLAGHARRGLRLLRSRFLKVVRTLGPSR